MRIKKKDREKERKKNVSFFGIWALNTTKILKLAHVHLQWSQEQKNNTATRFTEKMRKQKERFVFVPITWDHHKANTTNYREKLVK